MAQASSFVDIDWQGRPMRIEHQWLNAHKGDAPLWVDDSANVTVADVRARARRLQQQVQLSLQVLAAVVQPWPPGCRLRRRG